VRNDWCYNGEINTGGIGQIDVRTPPPVPAELAHLVCPDGLNTICCRIPDNLWSGGSSGSQVVWQGECDLHQACVTNIHCDGDNIINTAGVGLIDVRIQRRKCTIQDPDYYGNEGVCCNFPSPVPLLSCLPGQRCVPDNTCDGTVIKDSQNYPQSCYLDTIVGTTGTCCAPKPLVTCPGNQGCVANWDTCNVQAYGGAGTLDYSVNVACQYQGGTGLCCNPPPKLEPVYTCPGDGSLACIGNRARCRTDVYKNNYNQEQTCYVGDQPTGVCCEGPVASCATDGSYFCAQSNKCLGNKFPDPYGGGNLACYVGGTAEVGECCQTPTPVTSCGSADVATCTEKSNCFTNIIVNDYLDEKTCYLGGAGNNLGVCCTAPVKLQSCETGYSCNTPDLCLGEKAAINSFPDCYVTNSIVGKCCEPKPIVTTIDTCPGAGVCLPFSFCFSGEILAASDQVYYDRLSNIPWQGCTISGTGLTDPGVCCRNNIIPIDPEKPKLEPATECGVRNYKLDTRIANTDYVNYEAQFAEFPWQAIIFFTNFTFKCGASLIGNEWLLTAAHCVNGYGPNDLRIRLGEWKVDSYEEQGAYLDVDIEDIYIHPKFNRANLHNDPALIRLKKPVAFQYHINNVCLPEAGQVFYGQTRCYVTGWGKDAFDGGEYQVTMKKVDVPLVDKGECQQRLKTSRLGKFFILHESFLCAGGEVGKDACEGDGGGPLVCQDPATGRYVVAGITAWGIGCSSNLPGVYVDVQYFRKWIDDTITKSHEARAPTQQQTGGTYGRK